MSVIIPGWVHIPGRHCGSTALRDIMHFYGINLSEEMCFGLGAGLGFFYFENPRTSPSRSIMVRSAGMEAEFFRNTRKRFAWHTGEKDALEKVKEKVRNHVPVILQTDIYYLAYYNSKTHFAGHVITVWGYDDEEKCIYAGDTGWEELQKIPYQDLENAWTHSRPPFFIDHNWADVENPGEIDLEESIKRALLTQARDLLLPSLGKSALEKMHEFAERLPDWKNAEDWEWCARFAYQVIERRGTGGGAFRLMYAQFLKEASQITPLVTSTEAEEMFEIAGKWQKLAGLLKEISEMEKPAGLEKASRIMREIAEGEEKFFSHLLKKLGEGGHGVSQVRT